jgi:hypothetical protein
VKKIERSSALLKLDDEEGASPIQDVGLTVTEVKGYGQKGH